MRLWMNGVDRHGRLTAVAAIGLCLAVALALFGLPPVGIHTPLRWIGGTCPLCGMTRAVRLLVRGEVSEALHYNPASPLVLVGGVGLLGRWFVGRLTHRWVDLSVRWTPQLITVVSLAVAVLWIRQQAHADLLVHDHHHHG
jgi:uncharacterized protein DUF2752